MKTNLYDFVLAFSTGALAATWFETLSIAFLSAIGALAAKYAFKWFVKNIIKKDKKDSI